MTTIVERKEDMSPDGRLRLLIQDDGDVIVVALSPGDELHDPSMTSVEFCTPFAGGGGSKRTFKALHALAKAMQEDNEDASQAHRRGEIFNTLGL